MGEELEQELTAIEEKEQADAIAKQEKEQAEKILMGEKVGRSFLKDFIAKEVQTSDDPIRTIAGKLAKFGDLSPEARAILKNDPAAGVTSLFGDFAKGFAGGGTTTDLDGDRLKAAIALAKGEREEDKLEAAGDKAAKKEIIDEKKEIEEKEKKKIERQDKLRKEFEQRDVVKNFKKVRIGFGKLEASLNLASKTGDMAGVFELMKSLDPTSVVRESEYRTAAEAGSLWQTFKAKISNMEGKGRFTPKQRQEVLEAGNALARVWEKSYEDDIVDFSKVADGEKLNLDKIIVSRFAPIKLVSTAKPEEDDELDKFLFE